MRFYVNATSAGQSTPQFRLCVEGDNWVGALEGAWQLLRVAANFADLKITVSSASAVATDEGSGWRYTVVRAPEHALVTRIASSRPPDQAVRLSAPPVSPPVSGGLNQRAPDNRPASPVSETVGASVRPAVTAPTPRSAPTEIPAQTSASRARSEPPAREQVSLELLSEHDVAPSANSPLYYRERTFRLPGPVSRNAIADSLFRVLRRLAGESPQGSWTLVRLAVFEQAATTDATPMAALEWRQWQQKARLRIGDSAELVDPFAQSRVVESLTGPDSGP